MLNNLNRSWVQMCKNDNIWSFPRKFLSFHGTKKKHIYLIFLTEVFTLFLIRNSNNLNSNMYLLPCGLSIKEQPKPAGNTPLQVSWLFFGKVRPVQNCHFAGNLPWQVPGWFLLLHQRWLGYPTHLCSIIALTDHTVSWLKLISLDDGLPCKSRLEVDVGEVTLLLEFVELLDDDFNKLSIENILLGLLVAVVVELECGEEFDSMTISNKSWLVVV